MLYFFKYKHKNFIKEVGRSIANCIPASFRLPNFIKWRVKHANGFLKRLKFHSWPETSLGENIPIAYRQNKGFQRVLDSILLSAAMMVEIHLYKTMVEACILETSYWRKKR